MVGSAILLEATAGGDSHIRSSSNRYRSAVSRVVAAAFEVTGQDLHLPRRGRAKVALARQVAMYLAHVGLGLTLSDAGRLFRRDRTTAAHACRLVENLRDEHRFDCLMTILEEMVLTEIVGRAAKVGTPS